MTHIETMKLALEALTHLQPTALTSFYTIGDRDKAITSLRQAIEQAQQVEPVAWIEHHKAGDNLVWDEPHKGTPLYTSPPPVTELHKRQPEQAQKRPQNCGTTYCSCIECVMEPEQAQTEANERSEVEPVAWALWWEDDPDYFVDDYISTYKEVVEDEFLPTVVGNPKVIPLYTSPPQRQPLNFEQRMRICNECEDSVTLAILLTEAAHGIKENT